ncbi:hypothetical protein RI537_12380 [Aeromonas salmonicida]|uniref:hypothetical protein n=1 Tax=Aeromonas TaxID=642 RepID=UPI002B46912D|nr:hypothetical protein [Aeromonas caviae]
MLQMKKIAVLMCIPLLLSGVVYHEQASEPQQRMIMVNPGHLTPYPVYGVNHAPASDTLHMEPDANDPVYKMTTMK